jgi:uncharacterized protein YjbJ (UPF0337 family)
MNEDRIDGAAKKTVGGIKEATGKVIGDTSLENKGKAEKVEGDVQNKTGKVEDAVRP